MKNKTEETTASVSVYEFKQVCKEVDRDLDEKMARVFAQRRTYEKAMAYADALSDPALTAKSCWNMAEHAGYVDPGQFQSLMGENKWRAEDLWRIIAVTAGSELGGNSGADPLGTGMVVDETADEKRGTHTAGVSRQYAGCAGGIVNCVTSVKMSLITPTVKTWVSSRLFLPKKTWFTGTGSTGTARRIKAGIPDEIIFSSKPEIARQQFQDARDKGIQFNWAGGDEVYGRYQLLLRDHEDNNEAYAYFVPRNHVVTMTGGVRKKVDELLELADGRYEARSSGDGVNGPRFYQWALIEIEPENHFLLLRKPEEKEHGGQPAKEPGNPGGEPLELPLETQAKKAGKHSEGAKGDRVKDEGVTFCRCFIPNGSPIKPTMTNLVLMSGGRWGVEETMATGKGPIGWNENQFRKWDSMQRHTALAGLAMLKANMISERLAKITVTPGSVDDSAEMGDAGPCGMASEKRISAPETAGADLRIPLGDSAVPYSASQDRPAEIGFIRLSVNEILRLRSIVYAGIDAARMAFHLAWSRWRRKHQAIARWYHRASRIGAAQKPGTADTAENLVTLRSRRCQLALPVEYASPPPKRQVHYSL